MSREHNGVRTGLVGYGVGGRLFHAPYLTASDEIELVGVVARGDATIAAVRADHPDLAVYPSLTAMLDRGDIELVVVSTPPHTRRDLVVEALDHGVAVVADKPFAPSGDDAQVLADLARERGVLLNVFHNRRRDTDIVTAQKVLEDGVLGRIRGLDLRMDQHDPATLEAGPTGGLLRDLGSHVVDQALTLLGPAATVTAHLREVDTPDGPTDAGFSIVIVHTAGTTSRISASKVDHLVSKELRLYGDLGSYVSDYSDVQFAAITAGERPAGRRDTWGFEAPERWGMLRTDAGASPVPSAQGDYTSYYDDVARAVRDGGDGPVPAAEGVAVLRVLDAVRVSARESRAVAL